ncbi:dTDP-glucose 4,6-dehydratase [Belliella baltica DSM 15883]|uniref:dTDP-glucose 4,6-dehydratase n=1 Tax=Belliella baltica (strain DSM 15883 / CIP 108006 / LMG 21964 / BA134) TaxID=866536 RepID=I3Z607_BELBD|nr:dTDP-glucose 4,6-dehydratase [Belliella baltica]AFL84675.1 dTDP-glucose 4,6-dehydratase [Belliella baltica DSM 15883]
MSKNLLITGGAGFIGSHLVQLFVEKYKSYKIVNLDCLTYAGNLENLKAVEGASNYFFEKVNLLNVAELERVFDKHNITDVIHLAAESHVDRSISDPLAFVNTNVIGTVNLLNVAKSKWTDLDKHLFYHVSTDEVYGSLDDGGFFTEETPYDPQSPYSASKAASDHFVRAYTNTYGLRTVITNCSNNYGPNQFPEKLIPLCIHNIRNNKPLPVYGKGENIRDWLFVVDHARAIDLVFHEGKVGETYNIGGFNEWKNIDIVKLLCKKMDQKLNRPSGTSEKLITYVKDRAGHDLRYAIDANKIKNELGWKPSLQFEEGISKTIDWYLGNETWLNNVTSGNYQKYYEEHYQER